MTTSTSHTTAPVIESALPGAWRAFADIQFQLGMGFVQGRQHFDQVRRMRGCSVSRTHGRPPPSRVIIDELTRIMVIYGIAP